MKYNKTIFSQKNTRMMTNYFDIPHFYYGVYLHLQELLLLLLKKEQKFENIQKGKPAILLEPDDKLDNESDNESDEIDTYKLDEEDPKIKNKYYKKAYDNIERYLEIYNVYEDYDEEDYNDQISDNIENIKSELKKLESNIREFIDWYILDVGGGYYIYDYPENHLDCFDYYNDMAVIFKDEVMFQKDKNSFLVYNTISIDTDNEIPHQTLIDCFPNINSKAANFDFLESITDKKPGIIIKIQNERVYTD
jgi:hypothetical protein